MANIILVLIALLMPGGFIVAAIALVRNMLIKRKVSNRKTRL